MSADTNYNGWKNRPTWNVALWLGNDEGLYRAAIERCRDKPIRQATASIKIFCQEIWGTKTPDGDSLARVAWRDVANAFRE